MLHSSPAEAANIFVLRHGLADFEAQLQVVVMRDETWGEKLGVCVCFFT